MPLCVFVVVDTNPTTMMRQRVRYTPFIALLAIAFLCRGGAAQQQNDDNNIIIDDEQHGQEKEHSFVMNAPPRTQACKVDPEIVQLKRNAVTGEYQLAASDDDHDHSDIGGKNNRRRRDLMMMDDDPFSNGNETMIRNRDKFILVRSCSCYSMEPVYCPLEVDHCAIMDHYNVSSSSSSSNDSSSPLVCVRAQNTKDHVSEKAFFIALTWFSVLLTAMICTPWGPRFGQYLLSCCLPGYNKYLAQRLLETNPDRVRTMIHGFQNNNHHDAMVLPSGTHDDTPQTGNAQQQNTIHDAEMSSTNQPKSLALRTCIFRAEPSNVRDGSASTDVTGSPAHDDKVDDDDDDDDNNLDNQCIICFQTVQDGDRVGKLPCRHVFHSECLKTWLRRRNACPLCAGEIAFPSGFHYARKNSFLPPSSETTASRSISRQSSLSTAEVASQNDAERNDFWNLLA